MNSSFVLFFDEIGKADGALAGGKAANLGEMTRAGFPVPPGFCVTTTAYQAFVEANALAPAIAGSFSCLESKSVSRVGAELRERIREGSMPEAVTQAIRGAIARLGAQTACAVRSSATAEDLLFASYAGQQDTYLNVQGESALLRAIQDCWASLYSERAILYRSQNAVAHEKVRIAVVVQHLIEPDVSGIMFTADPVSGHRGLISIDAGYGLGEAFVAGLVSPDIYRVWKDGLRIDSKRIAEKREAILPAAGGGTQRVEIGGDQVRRQALADAEIVRLAALGARIEAHYGCPQDIEWCLERGQFYIVQSRPITSLFPLASPRPQDPSLHVYLSFGHVQMFTDPISPLGLDIIRSIIPLDGNVSSESEYKVFLSAAGRLYIDITGVLRNKRARAAVVGAVTNMGTRTADALASLVRRPDFDARISKGRSFNPRVLRIVLPVLGKVSLNLLFRNPEGTVARLDRFIEQHERQTAAALSRARPGIERLEAIPAAANLLPEFIKTIMPVLGTAVISYRVLGQLEKRLLGSDTYTNRISQGLEGNVATETGLLLGDLADQLRASPTLLAEFERPDCGTLMARLDHMEGQDAFRRDFNAFLDKYGCRAAGEIDIARDRWSEHPELLARSLVTMARTGQPGAHRREYAATVAHADAAAAALVRAVAEKHGKLQARLVSRLVRVVRNVLPIREHHKYLAMRTVMPIKQALLEEAGALVQTGRLADEHDIFYVGFWELRAALASGASLLELVERRKEEYRHFARLSAPDLMTSDGEAIKSDDTRGGLPAGALAGTPASAGVIEGIARVITDPAREALNKGEILVAPYTDPGWTPLFVNAAGLVMEIGGLLTHGTVVAREYGIPAVVGVSEATRRIKSGQRIRVDGDAGFVAVLDEETTTP